MPPVRPKKARPVDRARTLRSLTDSEAAEVAWLRESLGAGSDKEALLRAVRVTAALARRLREGGEVQFVDRRGDAEPIALPELRPSTVGRWEYLAERPHAWDRTLYVRGTRLAASVLCREMADLGYSEEQAADEYDLPVAAVREALAHVRELAATPMPPGDRATPRPDGAAPGPSWGVFALAPGNLHGRRPPDNVLRFPFNK